MKGAIWPSMTTLSDLWKTFRFLTDLETIPEDKKVFLHDFLMGEYRKREIRRVEYLLKMSGIKRTKLLSDFDWKFNPKVPRDKIMTFMQTDWLKIPANLVIIGPAGVGKTHVSTALCYDAVTKGRQTVFVSLFDLTAKLAKAKSVYSLIEYYARVPVLCLDELGYVIPSKEQADAIFQIISKRTESGTTIVTTNLVPSDWGKIFDTATASAILDRLSLNGLFITFEGRSYRSKK
jgi:DNA replication protein DnaC